MEGDRDTLVDGLRQVAAGGGADLVSSGPPRRAPASVGLLFSGQGTQYPGMTRRLYDAHPMYRENLDSAAAALDPHLGSDLLATIFSGATRLDHTSLAQPALFAVSYALGKTLLQSGIQVTFGIGHSAGEITAACLAGVFTVDTAAKLITARGRLMGALPSGGAMLAVDLAVEEAQALVADVPGCVIAAVNGPHSVTISGDADAVTRAQTLIRQRGGKAMNLAVSHAFHSPLMEPMVADFRHEMAGLEPGPADFPLFSTVLGRRSRGPGIDRRPLDAADLFTGAVPRRGPGRPQSRTCRLPRRGRSQIHAAHPRQAVRTAAADTLAHIVQRPEFGRDRTARRWRHDDARRLLTRSGGPVRRAGRPAAADPALCLRYLQPVLVRRPGRLPPTAGAD